MGRPKHTPTQDQRTKVRSLAACGISHEKIAKVMGFRSPKTLRTHYRQILEIAATEANASVAAALYSNAVNLKDTRAQEIWLKCRGGWHDRPQFSSQAQAPPPFLVGVEPEEEKDPAADPDSGMESQKEMV